MPEPDVLDIEIEETGPTVRATLTGTLDGATLPSLLDAVEPLVGEATSVVLDCDALRFCDSSGLRGFVLLRNGVADHGSFALVNVSSGLRQILTITGLTDLLDGDGATAP